jgi:hypothetical protein
MANPSNNTIPSEVIADLQKAAEYAAVGRRPDPDFLRRIARQAERIREDVKQKHGILDIGVSAIRELRDT